MNLDTESLKYEWGRLFASPWDAVVDGMAERARADGLAQEVQSYLWHFNRVYAPAGSP